MSKRRCLDNSGVVLVNIRVRAQLLVGLLVIVIATTAIGCSRADKPEDITVQFLKTTFSYTQQELLDYEELYDSQITESDEASMESSGDALTNFYKEKYADLVTDKCFDQIMNNRYCSKGLELAKSSNADISVGDIAIEKQKDSANEYSYSAVAYANDEELAYIDGIVTMSSDEKPQKIDYVTMSVKTLN